MIKAGIKSNFITVLANNGSKIYDQIKERSGKNFDEVMEAMTSGGDVGETINWQDVDPILRWFWTKFYQVYIIVRGIFPLALISSFVIAILLLLIVRKNKVLRKIAIYSFILGVPGILVLIVYVIPSLASIFIGGN